METFEMILGVTTLAFIGGAIVALATGAATRTLAFFPLMWILVAMAVFMLIYITLIDFTQRLTQ